jgi:hypothetical protein
MRRLWILTSNARKHSISEIRKEGKIMERKRVQRSTSGKLAYSSGLSDIGPKPSASARRDITFQVQGRNF